MQTHSHFRRGFTLVELAIVLGILGLLLTGLFQLTNASARQINNQVTSQQLQLYIKAAKSWIAAAKLDANGTEFQQYDANGTVLSAPLTTAVNGTYNITADLQGFKAGQLPTKAPNGGTYKSIMKRTADVGGRGAYVVVTTVVNAAGGLAYDRLQLGSIATFTGAEGAAIHNSNGTDAVASNCTGGMNAIGAFGGVCYDITAFGLEASRPATLSFINILDIGTTDSNYLWRVAGLGDLNKMTVDMSLGLGNKPSVTGNPDILFNGNGSIAMDGGSISGVNGGISTGGGGITSGGGPIDTGGGDLNLGISLGQSMKISVNTGGYLGATPSVYMPGYMEGIGANFTGTVEALGFNAQQFIYTTSDRTLKKDIQDLHNVLPALARLNGKRYTLRSSDHTDLGLIAQDVRDVFPELVAEHNGHLVLNYQGMVAPLVTGLNELAAENAALNARVTRLELLLNKQSK